MDLPTIQTVLAPTRRNELPPAATDVAFIAGGTWLFSEPQPGLRALVDLQSFAWPSIERSAEGLRIAATCTVAELAAYPQEAAWPATELFAPCARALAASFKVCNAATVGGNICLALPVASLAALVVALDGVGEVWRADGTTEYLAMDGFVLGPQQTELRPGDLLRAVVLPGSALRRRVGLRQISLSAGGRSAALLIGTRAELGAAASLTITASTRRPVVLRWPQTPTAAELDGDLASLPESLWLDDLAGRPTWRRHVTRLLAHEVLEELAG